jgi:hypothetical protein
MDPLATQTTLAATGLAVFVVLLLLLARIAARTGSALAPSILSAPIEPDAVRLLNNRTLLRS